MAPSLPKHELQDAIQAAHAGWEEEEFEDSAPEFVFIEERFRPIIHKRLHAIASRAGVPSDVDLRHVVRFPRRNEDSNLVELRGEATLVESLKQELEAETAKLRKRIVRAMAVPTAQHGKIIGKDGERVKELSHTYNVRIQIGATSRGPQVLGPPENEESLRGEDPANIIKVAGEREACEQAMAEILKLSTLPDTRTRVVLGVAIPSSVHPEVVIGKGGQVVKDLSALHGVKIAVPRGHNYDNFGDVLNVSELENYDPADIVKVSGSSQTSCEAAIADINNRYTGKPAKRCIILHIPARCDRAIAQQHFLKSLKDMQVSVDRVGQPFDFGVDGILLNKSDADGDAVASRWQVLPLDDSDDGAVCEWKLKSRDTAALEKARQRVEEELQRASEMTHVGFLTLPDQSVFDTVIASHGKAFRKVCKDNGVSILLHQPEDQATIVVMGKEADINKAKTVIMDTANGKERKRSKKRAKEDNQPEPLEILPPTTEQKSAKKQKQKKQKKTVDQRTLANTQMVLEEMEAEG